MIRIDKYLWAIRLFKTRTLASEACRKGQVLVGGQPAKPSRLININDTVSIKDPPVFREYKILNLAENRMAAKFVSNYLIETTSEDQFEILKLTKLANKLNRQQGTGRPTKKERRTLDEFLENQ